LSVQKLKAMLMYPTSAQLNLQVQQARVFIMGLD